MFRKLTVILAITFMALAYGGAKAQDAVDSEARATATQAQQDAAQAEQGVSDVSGGLTALEQRVADLEALLNGPPPTVANVDCGLGDSLQDALDDAVEGQTINVSGTCNERITVRIDNVTIDGGGTAIIDGTGISAPGSLLRVQALNVSILNLTVQKSPRGGIHVLNGGSATIQGTTSTGNDTHGIQVNRSSYALIGPESGFHPAAGDPPGNHIFNNTRHGIVVIGSANADIFHNLITGNNRGILIHASGSADIDGNEITGNTTRGIHITNNAAARLSTDRNHHDTGLGDTRPVVDLENNLIEGNGVGLRCRRGASATGNEQNFGVGNPGTGGTPHSGDKDIFDCHVSPDLFP